MPFVPAPEIIQVEMVYSCFGQICENVFHVQKAGGVTPSDLSAAQVVFLNWWTANMRATYHSGLSLTLIRARDMTTQTGLATELGVSTSNTGTITGFPALPNNVALAVKWTTGLSGRSYRGRTFHFAFSTNQLSSTDPDVVTATYAQALVTAYTALHTTCLTNTIPLVVLSKFANKVARNTAVATPILAVQVNTAIDSQRRRLLGRGS